MALVSVIIPVHDSERYLKQCLDSVTAQSFTDLRIIVVDDGSTDASIKIMRRYAAADSRFLLLSTPGEGAQGVSVARNTGLEAVTGEYFCFVDSDDILHPQAIESLVGMLTQYPQAEMALCSHRNFKKSEPKLSTYYHKLSTYCGHEAALAMLHQTGKPYLHHSPWGKLFRASLRSRMHFPEGKIYEDLAVIPTLTATLKQIIGTDRELYYYRLREDSLISAFHPRRLQVLEIALSLRHPHSSTHLLTPSSTQFRRAAEDRLFAGAFNIYLLTLGKPGYEIWNRRCRRILRLLHFRVLTTPSCRLRNRLGALIVLFPGLPILSRLLLTFPSIHRRTLSR